MAKIRIYMACDPHPNSRALPRIAVQEEPWQPHHYPPGHEPGGVHGEEWELRDLEVDKGTWTKILRGTMSMEAIQRTHARWWDEAAPKGAPTFEEQWDRQAAEARTEEPKWRDTVRPGKVEWTASGPLRPERLKLTGSTSPRPSESE